MKGEDWQMVKAFGIIALIILVLLFGAYYFISVITIN